MSMNAITAVLLLAVTIGYNAFPTFASNSIFIRTYVINCFPNTDYTAFITFERDRVNRLPYEGYSISNPTLQPNSDYLIQFREALTDIVHHNLTDYGFMGPRLHANMEILLVIRRDNANPRKPKNYLRAFDQTDVDSISSKLFIFNAMWNKKHPNAGINVYALYQRSNVDGSESESVTRLVNNLGMNQGREISLEPSKQIYIKVTYKIIGSVTEFKEMKVFIEKEDFTASAGIRHYLIVYGDYATKTKARPALTILSKMDSGSTVFRSIPLLTGLIIVLLLTVI